MSLIQSTGDKYIIHAKTLVAGGHNGWGTELNMKILHEIK
jgi:hypothetical protein